MIPIGTLCIIVSTSKNCEYLLGKECEVIAHCDYSSLEGKYHYTHRIRIRGETINRGITRSALLPITPPPITTDTPQREPKEVTA